MAEKQHPAHVFRMGMISASVWGNKRESGTTFYSVQLSRSYRDTNDEWKVSNYFNHSDLLNIAKLAERAEEWISRHQTRLIQGDADPASVNGDDGLSF